MMIIDSQEGGNYFWQEKSVASFLFDDEDVLLTLLRVPSFPSYFFI